MSQSLVWNTVDIDEYPYHLLGTQTDRWVYPNINWVHGLTSGCTHELLIIGSYPLGTTRVGPHGVKIVAPDMNGAI